jgi:hypothetical protein
MNRIERIAKLAGVGWDAHGYPDNPKKAFKRMSKFDDDYYYNRRVSSKDTNYKYNDNMTINYGKNFDRFTSDHVYGDKSSGKFLSKKEAKQALKEYVEAHKKYMSDDKNFNYGGYGKITKEPGTIRKLLGMKGKETWGSLPTTPENIKKNKQDVDRYGKALITHMNKLIKDKKIKSIGLEYE